MIINFENNFSNELNLENFIDNYGIDKQRFYSKYSFYKLLAETGFRDNYRVKDIRELSQALRRFSSIDSKKLLNFSDQVLRGKLDINTLTKAQGLMLGMLHYSLWGKKPPISYRASLENLKNNNPDLVDELLDIIEYNRKSIRIKEIPYENQEIPLEIYASYSLQQIMVAFGKTREDYEYPMREGTLYIEEENTDLFFITINKNEEDYLPSTMYNDYAKNSELFNWESQSTTGVDSPTGQRYINDRSDDHKILLFVREYRQKYNHAQPYVFLGNARYYSHKGTRPIEFVWKMDHPIPERIIRGSNLRVVD